MTCIIWFLYILDPFLVSFTLPLYTLQKPSLYPINTHKTPFRYRVSLIWQILNKDLTYLNLVTRIISLFYNVNKLGQWDNLIFNLCNGNGKGWMVSFGACLLALYKLVNLNYTNLLPNVIHFKIICHIWRIKSESTISRKM